ncbi:MAG: diguanylate cyclase [Oscillospiraceae bacterium]|nr:diguanylate cyclase [Oscillospiraceae bacterium]
MFIEQISEFLSLNWLYLAVALVLALGLFIVFFVKSLNANSRTRAALESERRAQQQAALLTTLFDAMRDIVFLKDADLKLIFLNKAFEEHFGREKDEALGKTVEESALFSTDTARRFDEKDMRIIKGDEAFVEEEELLQVDGTTPLFETVRVPVKFAENETGSLNISRDITKRKEAETAALEASKAKSDFLAKMSHEIRTPMNSILGFAELALDDDIPHKTRKYLTNILKNSEWLLQIINNILDLSKIESGKLDLEHIAFDPHKLFVACRKMIAPKAIEKGIDLHFYAEPISGKRPLGDPTKLTRILMNLLSNAVKFTDEGKISLRGVIENRSETTVEVLVEIEDTGIGMSDEQIAKIHSPFERASDVTTRKHSGAGLGISVAKKLIEVMGGKLKVQSELGVGSKFSFNLTFELTDEREQLEKTVTGKPKKPNFSGVVLLCEDNEMNRQVISEHLARVGLEVIVAENGKNGVEMVEQRIANGEKHFDLIFMDMYMPVMDGFEASEKILSLDPNAAIIAVTANVTQQSKDYYARKGIKDCVGKPFTSQELWNCLAKHLTVESYSDIDKHRHSKDTEKTHKSPGLAKFKKAEKTNEKTLKTKSLMFIDKKENIEKLTEILSDEYEIYAEGGEPPEIVLLGATMLETKSRDVPRALKVFEEAKDIPIIIITEQNAAQYAENEFDFNVVDYISEPLVAALVKTRVRQQIMLIEQQRAINQLSMHDPLTGLANRLNFESKINTQWRITLKKDSPLSLLMLDIDRFKEYNDTYGHQQGDAALTAVAKALNSAIARPADFVTRWGGQEFIILLSETDLDGALGTAERVRSFVEDMEIPVPGGMSSRVTISVGVNTRVPGQYCTIDDFIAKAEKALHRAKKSGRNRVSLYR